MKILLLLLALVLPTLAVAQTIPTMVGDMAAEVKGKTMRIAVLEFSYSNHKASPGPAIIQERITTAMAKAKVGTLVERSLLNRVMGELKLQRSGIMDETTIKKLGKVLGVDAVVVGTLNDLDKETTEVNARLVNTETAEIISAGSAIVDKTWFNEAALIKFSPEATDLAPTKSIMDARLAQVKGMVGKNINPREDGLIDVNGVAVDADTFDKAIMSAILNDVKAKGKELPPMAKEGQ